jgi:hypothetical protein
MEEIQFKPKLRVTLLQDNGAVIQDRLVDSQPEYYNGPKIQHKGPIRIEVTLTNNQDVVNFKEYLDRLVGNLPIKEPSVGRGRPSTSSGPQIMESPREDILQAVEKMVSEGKDQTEVIKYLRDLGFVFILTEDLLYYFNDFPFDIKDIGEPTENKQYLDSMSWMIRCIKRAKDPKTDKFDPMIIFGFNILRQASNKVVPYLYKERKKPLRIEIGKKSLSFNTVEFTKFPKYMQEQERLKFSFEQRQLLLNPDKKPSKFFLRWYKDVVFPDTIKPKIKEAITRGQETVTT